MVGRRTARHDACMCIYQRHSCPSRFVIIIVVVVVFKTTKRALEYPGGFQGHEDMGNDGWGLYDMGIMKIFNVSTDMGGDLFE